MPKSKQETLVQFLNGRSMQPASSNKSCVYAADIFVAGVSPLPVTDDHGLSASATAAGPVLEATEPCQHEECDTPFYHEIPLGALPSASKARCPPTPSKEKECYRESTHGQAWDERAPYSNSEMLRRLPLANGPGESAALLQSTRCSATIPAAAAPAYFLV